MSKYWDTNMVSDETGIPAATLRYWRHADIGPASFTLGRRVVYRPEDVEAWIRSQEQATRRGGGDANACERTGERRAANRHELDAMLQPVGGGSAA